MSQHPASNYEFIPLHTLYPFETTRDTLEQAFARAIIGAETPELAPLKQSLPTVHTQPAATLSRPALGSAWHDGEFYDLFWAGDPALLLQRSELTENEREYWAREARRLSFTGDHVYCVAQSRIAHAKHIDLTAVRPTHLTLLGLVSVATN